MNSNILNNEYTSTRFQLQQSSSTPSTNTYSHQAHKQTWLFLEKYDVARPTQLCEVPISFHLWGRRPDAYKHIISPRIKTSNNEYISIQSPTWRWKSPNQLCVNYDSTTIHTSCNFISPHQLYSNTCVHQQFTTNRM